MGGGVPITKTSSYKMRPVKTTNPRHALGACSPVADFTVFLYLGGLCTEHSFLIRARSVPLAAFRRLLISNSRLESAGPPALAQYF